MNNERDNVIEFKRNSQFNIGIVICVIIFIYVCFRLLSYVTSDEVTVYEVKKGTIVSDNNYRALIIRQEQVINADTNGYVYFFSPEESRVGVKSLVYAVDETGSIISNLESDLDESNPVDISSFEASNNIMSSFVDEYDSNKFQKTYSFKEQLSNTLNALRLDAVLAEHNAEIEDAIDANTYHAYYAPEPGIVSYSIDGFENVTENDFDPACFDKEESYVNTKSNTEINSGESAYKLITSDDWKLVVPIDNATRDKLADETAVLITFDTDSNKTWGAISFLERDETPYLVLSMDDSMERYANMRFVGVELAIDEQSGLKIPNSAIVDKKFYTIPKSYFLAGNNSSELGLLKKVEDGTEFITPTIFKETKDYYYIDNETVSKGDKICLPDSLDTYTIGKDTDKLKGVYNVNKGYAVFKQIETIQENEEYTIIKSGTSYGLALYDHIVLQGDNVEENEIIGR